MTNFTLKRRLRRALANYRGSIYELNQLVEAFEMNGYDYCIIGGFVRSIYLGKNPRDIDIIVDILPEDLDRIIAHYNPPHEKNNFGSYKINGKFDITNKPIDIDVWTLRNHSPFKTFKKNGLKTGWKQLPDSAWISIDGATWLPRKNKVYAKNLKRTIKKNEISFINYDLFKGPVDNKYIIVSKLVENCQFYDLDENCWRAMDTYFTKHPNNSSLIKILKEKNEDDMTEEEINNHINYLRVMVPELTKKYDRVS